MTESRSLENPASIQRRLAVQGTPVALPQPGSSSEVDRALCPGARQEHSLQIEVFGPSVERPDVYPKARYDDTDVEHGPGMHTTFGAMLRLRFANVCDPAHPLKSCPSVMVVAAIVCRNRERDGPSLRRCPTPLARCTGQLPGPRGCGKPPRGRRKLTRRNGNEARSFGLAETAAPGSPLVSLTVHRIPEFPALSYPSFMTGAEPAIVPGYTCSRIHERAVGEVEDGREVIQNAPPSSGVVWSSVSLVPWCSDAGCRRSCFRSVRGTRESSRSPRCCS